MKRLTGLILITIMLLSGLSAEAQVTRQSAVGFYLDTVITLTAFVEDKALLDSALAKCGEYEKLLSKTVEGSDVWHINHANGEPVSVSGDVITILETALRVSDISLGAFDVSVAPAVALWDFTGDNDTVPDADSLAAAAANIDYKRILIDGDTVTLEKGMQIDLGGVAKGYIADKIAEYLKANGVDSAILSFGGNIIAVGKKPEGKWSVGIQDPKKPTGAYLFAISLTDMAAVTSGINERFFERDGVIYHHILDTKTGMPVQNELAAVTIIAENSMLADALSTAVFALGLDKGVELIDSLDGVEAIFIDRENSVFATSGAADLIITQ